jgi:uncharacterized protein YdbL (DUF1318 family)
MYSMTFKSEEERLSKPSAQRARRAASNAVSSGTAPKSGGATAATDWLVLIYRVPSEPTRLRAAVWRRLKAIGAIYLQSSVAVLPATSANERALRSLRNDVVGDEIGGWAVLLSTVSLVGENDIVEAFNRTRNDEYDEIGDKCHDFIVGIDKEIAEQHFTFAELEENEEELNKLRRWYEKIRGRDLLAASGRAETEAKLEACAEVLDRYAHQVYHSENP